MDELIKKHLIRSGGQGRAFGIHKALLRGLEEIFRKKKIFIPEKNESKRMPFSLKKVGEEQSITSPP